MHEDLAVRRPRRDRPLVFFLLQRRPPRSTLFPYTTLFRSACSPSVPSSSSPTGTTPISSRTSGCSRRSEEHTSELQSRLHLVCRLLLEKKKTPQRSPLCGAALMGFERCPSPCSTAVVPIFR